MKRKPRPARREPRQPRAQATVEAVLDGVIRILKREGVEAVTTNHIAEVAGVSVGSVYQYFPDKRAIFQALHDRHAREVSQVLERALVEHADAPLEGLMRGLLEAIIDAHTPDPELFDLLDTEVPHRAAGTHDFETRLRGVLRLALAARSAELGRPEELEKLLGTTVPMVNALAHGAALHRPSSLSKRDALGEAVRAIVGYLKSPGV